MAKAECILRILKTSRGRLFLPLTAVEAECIPNLAKQERDANKKPASRRASFNPFFDLTTPACTSA
jgi:hypothetical protein